VLADPQGRLPGEVVERLATRLGRESGNPRLGFQALERSHPNVFQTVGFAMMSCSCLLDALQCLARCTPVLNDGLTARVEHEAAGYRFVLQGALPPPLLHDTGLAALLGFCRFMTGGEPLRVLEACIPDPPPAKLDAHRALLGTARLRFDEPQIALLLDATQLERPLVGATVALQALHRQLANLQLDAVRHNRLTSHEVRQHIAQQLDGRAPTLRTVAETMGRSPRSLQRALSQEGSSFTALLDDTRRGLAHLYLHHSQLPLKELAFQLGFGELSSFYRACMRWFGQTPRGYRRSAATEAGAAAGRGKN
jgi:AraC-like DNA-binding protein